MKSSIISLQTTTLTKNQPLFVHKVADVRTLPPIMYPGIILNAAVNFYSHVDEQGTDAERREARRQRREERGVPYLFIKPSRGAVIGKRRGLSSFHTAVTEPTGKSKLGTVIGRTAKLRISQ